MEALRPRQPGVAGELPEERSELAHDFSLAQRVGRPGAGAGDPAAQHVGVRSDLAEMGGVHRPVPRQGARGHLGPAPGERDAALAPRPPRVGPLQVDLGPVAAADRVQDLDLKGVSICHMAATRPVVIQQGWADTLATLLPSGDTGIAFFIVSKK